MSPSQYRVDVAIPLPIYRTFPYAVDADSLPSEIEVSHVNLNDGTVEGLRHRSLPIMSIQYHSEASPGPRDNEYLFDRFLDLVRESRD